VVPPPDETPHYRPSLRLGGRRAHDAIVSAMIVTVVTKIRGPSSSARWETVAPIMFNTIPA